MICVLHDPGLQRIATISVPPLLVNHIKELLALDKVLQVLYKLLHRLELEAAQAHDKTQSAISDDPQDCRFDRILGQHIGYMLQLLSETCAPGLLHSCNSFLLNDDAHIIVSTSLNVSLE